MSESFNIAISGIGAITAIGATLEASWERIYAGGSGIAPITAFDTRRYATNLAAEVRDFDPRGCFGFRTPRSLDRCHALALTAAREAFRDASLSLSSIKPARAAIIIGSSLGGTITSQHFERTRIRNGSLDGRRLHQVPLHSLLEHLASAFGFRGPRMVFSTACTASTLAIAYAAELLRSGRADIVLTGGVDPLAELSFAGFSAMGNVSSAPCAPFSGPVGLTLGEGAAMLVLETSRGARERGHEPRAILSGYGLSADAYHATSGDPSGRPQARAIHLALSMAGLAPEDVGYVNAHGTGTAGNDPVETRILHQVFGPHVANVAVSSLKGAVGHTLGAAGAIEAAMTALALQRRSVPPTANFVKARAECNLDYVPNQGRQQSVRHALSLNFAFGGNNAALVLSHKEHAPSRPAVNMRRRVVVTGVGALSPIAIGADNLVTALAENRDGIAPLRRLEGRLGSTRGACIERFAPQAITRADLRRTDRIGSFIVCAAELAMRDAGIVVDSANQDRIGIAVGTGHGSLASCRGFFEPAADQGSRRLNPALFPNTVMNAGAGLAALQLRVKGPNAALSCGQASGLAALCFAHDIVGSGLADMMIAGGAEELEQPLLDGYAAARRIAPHNSSLGVEVCAPFDVRRSGPILGEGATFLVLEALDSALARGARIYAEVAGWAGNADQPVLRGWDPTGEGLSECMHAALRDADLMPDAIGLVAAAAMSHPHHDLIEANAINQVFGRHRVPVAALASRVGVSAATAPLAAAASVLGMKHSFVPSGIRRLQPDSACDIHLVEGAATEGSVGIALINASALGGTNYCLILRDWRAS